MAINTLALLRFGSPPGGAGELIALYVSLPEMKCAPSRQKYQRLGPSTFTYIDLGIHDGLRLNSSSTREGFVRQYEGLFERVEP
jgi:hypothetical protein